MISSTKEHEITRKGGDLILADEVYAIVGAALEVRKELGVGFLEAVYQEALGVEFPSRRIPFIAQRPLRITYKGKRWTRSTSRTSSAMVRSLLNSKPSESSRVAISPNC
jgi:hypothetical protein